MFNLDKKKKLGIVCDIVDIDELELLLLLFIGLLLSFVVAVISFTNTIFFMFLSINSNFCWVGCTVEYVSID